MNTQRRMVRTASSCWLLLCMILFAIGCSSEPVPIVGGTTGTLTSGGKPMSQIQVNVYDDKNAMVPIGRGNVGYDGTFALVTHSGLDALELPAGTYFFTVESVGAEVEIPSQYTQPNETPLVVTHQDGESLNLSVPGLSRGM